MIRNVHDTAKLQAVPTLSSLQMRGRAGSLATVKRRHYSALTCSSEYYVEPEDPGPEDMVQGAEAGC